MRERKVVVYKYAEAELSARQRRGFSTLENITNDLEKEYDDWDIKHMTSSEAGIWVV